MVFNGHGGGGLIAATAEWLKQGGVRSVGWASVAGGAVCVAGWLLIKLAHNTGSDQLKKVEKQDRLERIWIVDKLSGEEVDIPTLLDTARANDKWLVAYDAGRYSLHIADRYISLDVLNSNDFNCVLSHRWHPTVSSTFGTFPLPFADASFPEPTWVDVINHFNCEEHVKRVLSGMGKLYATKACRALYFEGNTDFATQLEAATRAWMWQELSLGPQKHEYNSQMAVWLHHAVVFGDQEMFMSIHAITITIIRLALTSRRFKLRAPASYGLGTALKDARRGIFCWLSQSQQDCDEAATMLTELDSISSHHADLPALLADVLGTRLGEKAETSSFITAVCAEIGGSSRVGIQEGLWAVVQVLLCVEGVMLQCLRGVLAARRRPAFASGIALGMWGQGVWLYEALLGGRGISMELSQAAVAMLQSRRALDRTASALENLGNSNLSFDADRLPASFGVLCAAAGLPCTAASVERMMQQVRFSQVPCMARSEACGIESVTRKAVCVSARGRQTAVGWSSWAVFLLLSGKVVEMGMWDEVAVSGLRLRNCFVNVFWSWPGSLGASGWGFTTWLAGPGRSWDGEVIQYAVDGDCIEQIIVQHSPWFVMSLGQGRGSSAEQMLNVPKAAFHAWYASLPDATQAY